MAINISSTAAAAVLSLTLIGCGESFPAATPGMRAVDHTPQAFNRGGGAYIVACLEVPVALTTFYVSVDGAGPIAITSPSATIWKVAPGSHTIKFHNPFIADQTTVDVVEGDRVMYRIAPVFSGLPFPADAGKVGGMGFAGYLDLTKSK